MDIGDSVSVSVSAETESFIWFPYQFWPKRKIAISACFGFGRNEKKPFGRTLCDYLRPHGSLYSARLFTNFQ